MENKNFMTVDEVAQELNVSKSYAYKQHRGINKNPGLKNPGFFSKKETA